MKKFLSIGKLVILVIVATYFSVQAQKLFPRPPIFGIPAKTLPHNHWIFRGYWINDNYNSVYDAGSGTMKDAPAGVSSNSNVIWGKLRYGFSDNFTFILNIPYVHKRITINGNRKTGNGIGDIIAAGLYKIYHDKRHKFLFSALAFTKYATGKSSNLSTNELPTGSGSFDYGLSLLPEKEFGKWDIRLSAFYLFRGENNSGVNLGDMLSLSWSSAYNFSKNLIGEGTLYYKKTYENYQNDKLLPGSDTYVFQFIPGIQLRLLNSFLVQLVVPINISQKRAFGNAYETWFGLYYMM